MIKKLKSSLTAKIFILTALLLSVCCIATYGFIAWLIPKTYPNQVDMNRAELYAYEAAQELRKINIEFYPTQAEMFKEFLYSQFGGDLEFHVFDESGNEIAPFSVYEQTGKTISDYAGVERTQEYSFTFSDSADKYRLIYVNSSQAVNQAMEALDNVFPYIVVTVAVISLLTAFIYSRYITAPIKKINRASQEMALLDFSVRCDSNRTDELGSVANTMNLLAAKLSSTLNELEKVNVKLLADFNREKQLETQRTELFASVSHELKTPITIVKGQLQGMIGGVGRYKDRDTYLVQSLEAVTKLEIMVQEILMVARMEAPDYICTREPFDLSLLIKQCLTVQEDLFIQKSTELISNLPKGLTYTGDIQLLKRVFDNLIANALTYSPQGQSVFVDLTKDDTGVKFRIENTGVHIDETDLTRVFEAFYRTEQSRNRQTGGSGLGLYIVKKILDLHGATYSIANTDKGVVFTAIL